MPLTSILIIVGIVAAFTAFGLTLAWGELIGNLVRRDESGAAGAREKQDFKRAA